LLAFSGGADAATPKGSEPTGFGESMDKTPASLLERLRKGGSQEAWETFVRLFAPMIYRWARRVGLAADLAADLVQDVFLILLEKLPKFEYDKRRSFRAWLKTVVLNKWRDGLRKGRFQPTGVPVSDCSEPASPDFVPFLEEAEYQQYLVDRAMQLIQADYEPTTWKAWWNFAVVGRPAREVAAELGITPNAVYLAKARVMAGLREKVDGLLD